MMHYAYRHKQYNPMTVDTSYSRVFIMQTHKPSMIECKRDAKATWTVGPPCNLTEWQQWQNELSPYWIARQLFVSSLIFSFFRWCVGKEGSPLCQATRLKSKVGSGCIWVVCVCAWRRLRERGMSTQCTNCLDPCFSMIPRTNNVSWEK